MPELPKRNTGQDRRVDLPPDRPSGVNDAAKLAAARAALARAATAHRADIEDGKATARPEPPVSITGRDESATGPAAAPDDRPRSGPRRPPAKWIAIASVAVAVVIAGAVVTISGSQGEDDRQSNVAGEPYQSDANEPEVPDVEPSLSASASAAASSRPPSTGSPTPSGRETEPGTGKAAKNDAEPTVSKAPDKDGTGRAGGSAPDPGRALAVEASGNCLTGAGSGSELVVAACTGAASQSWNTGSDTALQQGDLCATVTGTEDRAPVVLAPCDQSAAQRFSLSGKSLLSASSGKCLDLFGGASGTQVVLWECNGRDNQRWSTT